ncbi:putative LRR receptor-like serine/threonine-protein kinase [Nymphaea thermarum]|nr:putative LRR receptor-like serine/threonine-protein kinase [Nymphaea thermarum]
MVGNSICVWRLWLMALMAGLVSVAGMEDPNTDGYFVASFFQKMGLTSSSLPNENFRDDAPTCSWKGVVFCGTGGRVTRLVASGFDLSGPIPDTTVGKLSGLEDLDLSNNSVSGFSSDFWGLGATLRSLNLSMNGISGFLPNDVGNLGSLRVLDLSHNNLSGEIPATFSSLTTLKVLNLKGNAFEGRIPGGIVNCAALVSLDLSLNRLSGKVPSRFASSLTELRELNLAENGIVGRGSDLFLGLKSVVFLNVSGNQFQGSLSGALSLPSLQVLDVSRNWFQGHISSANARWSASLAFVDLSENQLSGDIFIAGSRSLKHLNLARNRFARGSFPPGLLELAGLQFLNLSGTGLIGNLPTGKEMSNLRTLAVLDISHNFIAGRIPDGLERLEGLNQLDFSWNNLSGEIPLPLQEKLPKMGRFNFSYNFKLTICSSIILPRSFPSSFLGLNRGSCPIAVNPSAPKTGTTEGQPKHRGLKLAVAVVVAAVCLFMGLVCLVLACRRRPRLWAVKQLSFKEEQPAVSGPFSFQTDSTTWVADVKVATSVPVVMFEKPLLNYTFADLLVATSNFDRGTLLAEGRYGPVYRGVLPGGMHVAVKVLVNSASVGDEEVAQELERIGRIKHPNLVSLTGYCFAGEQRIAIYEFMDHGSLQRWLHDLPIGTQITEDWSNDTWEEDDGGGRSTWNEGVTTTWQFRHRVALGTARALAYLHHGCIPQIIHRDVKASSIYLDSSLEPRLSDFGLAKITMIDLKSESSSTSWSGYLPPELVESETYDAVSPKSDVYGFGVVLFELITGKKPVGDDYSDRRDTNLVSWVRDLVRKNDASSAIDPKIAETGLKAQMVEGLRIGYLCTADLPSKRPSMQQVVGLLKDIEPSAHQ